MKSFRKDGRIASFLKLSLPRIVEQGEVSVRFNEFYLSLAEAYQALASKIAEGGSPRGIPTSVSVSFADITGEKSPRGKRERRKNIIFIRRTAIINGGGEVKKREWTDAFDADGGFFIK